MKCPLIMVNRTWGEEEKGLEGDRCLQAECAWWYEKNQCCAILTLAQGSVYVHKTLLSLGSKLPLGILK